MNLRPSEPNLRYESATLPANNFNVSRLLRVVGQCLTQHHDPLRHRFRADGPSGPYSLRQLCVSDYIRRTLDEYAKKLERQLAQLYYITSARDAAAAAIHGKVVDVREVI